MHERQVPRAAAEGEGRHVPIVDGHAGASNGWVNGYRSAMAAAQRLLLAIALGHRLVAYPGARADPSGRRYRHAVCAPAPYAVGAGRCESGDPPSAIAPRWPAAPATRPASRTTHSDGHDSEAAVARPHHPGGPAHPGRGSRGQAIGAHRLPWGNRAGGENPGPSPRTFGVPLSASAPAASAEALLACLPPVTHGRDSVRVADRRGQGSARGGSGLPFNRGAGCVVDRRKTRASRSTGRAAGQCLAALHSSQPYAASADAGTRRRLTLARTAGCRAPVPVSPVARTTVSAACGVRRYVRSPR